MKRRRVKITGIGPVTPAGIGREEFWKGILEPVSRVRIFNRLGQQYGPMVAAYLDTFNVRNYIDHSRIPKGSSRQTQFAIAAAVLALKDAGIAEDHLSTLNAAVVNGSSLMDFDGVLSSFEAIAKYGERGAKPRNIYTANTSSTPRAISTTFKLNARTIGVQSACCGGVDAIGRAAAMIADGEVDIALCGGTEAPLVKPLMFEIRAAGLTPLTSEMAERADRPFDLWRTTGVVSEGASYFVLEPEESPRKGYSYIEGYGSKDDEPNDLCGGLKHAINMALADARVRPQDIDAISAWGPGHIMIDAAESKTLMTVFGLNLGEIPIVSIKGAIGTPLAAAPAIQVAAAALAQRFSIIPPTVNWEHPDPSCPLNLSKVSRTVPHSLTLVDTHGLGGLNSAMILRRC